MIKKLTPCNHWHFYSARMFCTDIAASFMQMDKRTSQSSQSGFEPAPLRNLCQLAKYPPRCPPASTLDVQFYFQVYEGLKHSLYWVSYDFYYFTRITKMNEPRRSKNDQNSKRHRKISRDGKSERRNGRDRRKGVDRRSGFDRRRSQDREATERKNLTREWDANMKHTNFKSNINKNYLEPISNRKE